LPALLDTIKADAAVWLLEEQCTSLRRVLMEQRPPLPLPLARVSRREPEPRHDDGVVASTAGRAS
jgi:hypothetical protein